MSLSWSSLQVLPFPAGTPEQVREEVLARLPILEQGGGYVFDAIHNIVGDTKPENIWAAFKAVHDYNAKYHA